MPTQLDHPYIAPKVAQLPKSSAVESALQLADFAHQGQTRREYGLQEPVPYLAHPLRNAHLVWLWTHDYLHDTPVTELVAASLLHDTVEDAPERIQEFYDSDRAALDLIRAHFGARVGDTVGRVTMPTIIGACGVDDRNVTYLEHILSEVVTSEYALITKAADLVDNAGSLWRSPLPPARVKRLASKYAAPVDAVIAHCEVIQDHRVRAVVYERLTRLRSSLEEVQAS